MTTHVQNLPENRFVRGWRDLQRWSRDLVVDERGDVPGWVLVTLMTAGLPVIRVSG